MCVGFGFSSVTFRPSRAFHSHVFGRPSVDTDRVLEVARIFTKHSKCCDKFFVLTMSLHTFISLLYKQLAVITVHAVEIFHCTIHFINQISKQVPYETYSIHFHFHKIVHENTFALTPPCFIWVSRAIAKHRSYCFLSMFKLRCIRHYRNLATYTWCTTWR